MLRLPPLDGAGRDPALPLYEQVATVLTGEIERGAIRRGTPLPAERAICEQMGISRVTLRRALGVLEERGLVVPSHGRGWFVNDSLIGELPNSLQGFSEIARARGSRPGSSIFLCHVREAGAEEADELEIGAGSNLFEMRRVRLLDGRPVAVDHTRLPLDVCPHLAEADFERTSLYDLLEQHGAAPSRCDFSVQAISADDDHAGRLAVPAGSPLLLAVGTTFDRSDRPIELSRVAFVGDRYRFRATLFRRPDARRTRIRRGGQP